ncbi:hypothetical protein [Paenibacillus psychroresistens]|uniref:hypothetical protein n=1 Tax=Paenibacillus psychroresistens TaxID=1778678 RepID=UPI001878AC37|nr:hypothetical protein [Paenibacillus psychroresistens]
MNKKLDLIIAKLEEHDKRFDQHDKKFEQQDKRFELQDKKFELLLARHDDHDKNFERMFSRLGQHEDMIVSLIKSVATNSSCIEELQTDMKEVKTDMKEVKEDVKYIKGDVSQLKENQQIMLLMQQDQQKILERLSFRSITHEADIAELRRIK